MQSFDTLGPCQTIYPWLPYHLILFEAWLEKITRMGGCSPLFLLDILNFISGSNQIIKELYIWATSLCSLRELSFWGLHFAVRGLKLRLLEWHYKKQLLETHFKCYSWHQMSLCRMPGRNFTSPVSEPLVSILQNILNPMTGFVPSLPRAKFVVSL